MEITIVGSLAGLSEDELAELGPVVVLTMSPEDMRTTAKLYGEGVCLVRAEPETSTGQHTDNLHPNTVHLLRASLESFARHRSGLEVFTEADRIMADLESLLERWA